VTKKGGSFMLDKGEYSSLHQMSDQEAELLCERLRFRLLDVVSQTGGHLASNFGIVELTVALHRVFDTSSDRLVFDVGHQCYIHKMLTGRNALMETIRSFGGLAGFPKPGESKHDAFIAGHASNAVSVALGMAIARTRLQKNYSVIALLGDGALTGGLSYEGLSAAGQSGEPLIVILNDNGMSITKNVGGIARHLAHQRLKPQYLRIKKWYRKVMRATALGRGFYQVTHKLKAGMKAALLPSSMFEDMGFQYMGPVDGHDVKGLTRLFQQAKEIQTPVLIHVRTVKGKGYAPAEKNPDSYHGIAPFHKENGCLLHPSKRKSFSNLFGEVLCELARTEKTICAITAAMEPGTGLTAFAKEFPDRFFDVGIAEGHAATMAAGMAKQGLLPVFAVYSSFFQRSYDMLIHDVAIQRLHVVFCVDRAGLVGDDGETHHGLFDVAFLNTVPGMTVLCPASNLELKAMLNQALTQLDGPVSVRYSRGSEGEYGDDFSHLSAVKLTSGEDITLVSYGTMINQVLQAATTLEETGIHTEVIKLNRITPLDTALIAESVTKTGRILVAEDVISMGCIGERILAQLMQRGITLKDVVLCNCGDNFVTHGSIPELQKLCGLDAKTIVQRVKGVCKRVR
jgi:1-deoxy-D-xylulose-5-phosphate synthase